MNNKPGTKICTRCKKIRGIAKFTKESNICKPCLKTVTHDSTDQDSDDDMKERCKKLEKRVKKLEKTVTKLQDMLEGQCTKTFGIEKMIEGFTLGIKYERDEFENANIVELSD